LLAAAGGCVFTVELLLKRAQMSVCAKWGTRHVHPELDRHPLTALEIAAAYGYEDVLARCSVMVPA